MYAIFEKKRGHIAAARKVKEYNHHTDKNVEMLNLNRLKLICSRINTIFLQVVITGQTLQMGLDTVAGHIENVKKRGSSFVSLYWVQ